jgi:two-component system cell cycle sensor histidine kinase/response regulator CckA
MASSRRQPTQPTVLDINAVIEGSSSMLRRLIGEEIDLVIRLDTALGFVKADAGQIEQILMNLAINAKDAIRWRFAGDQYAKRLPGWNVPAR